MKTFKTRTVHFVFSLRTFVSAHVIITSITAPGMSINLSLVALLLLAGSLVFEILLSINGKKVLGKVGHSNLADGVTALAQL